MLAEHVWEHLTPPEARTALANCYDYLKLNSVLRIAVPDGYHPNPSYINYVRPGGSGPGADDHKVLYNVQTLTHICQSVGFTTICLEYFDENNVFHFTEWEPETGMVRRSSRFDPRNKETPLNYTSLIVDAVKLR